MSRSTQFIGLNFEARKFLEEECTPLKSVSNTTGMFGEEIPLKRWKHKSSGYIYREIVQCSPWSSGPMILTCLQGKEGKKFEWIEDSSTYGEVDPEKGTFWI